MSSYSEDELNKMIKVNTSETVRILQSQLSSLMVIDLLFKSSNTFRIAKILEFLRFLTTLICLTGQEVSQDPQELYHI